VPNKKGSYSVESRNSRQGRLHLSKKEGKLPTTSFNLK